MLISAIVNTGDLHLGRGMGVRPEHFSSTYRFTYEWLFNFNQSYGKCPDRDELLMAWPNVPYYPDYTHGISAANEIKRVHGRADLFARMNLATEHLQRGEVEDAFAVFQGVHLDVAVKPPENALLDHAFLDGYEDRREPRIPLPWQSLQTRTDGIGPGELWYFAARQGHGKSSFLLDIAAGAALAGRNVIIYSMEMTKRQTQVRLQAAIGHRLGEKVDASAMLRKTWPHADYKNLLQVIEDSCPGQIMIHEVSGGQVTPALVDQNAPKYDLSVIDYVGLMRNDDRIPAIKDYRIIAEISNSLKATALSRNHAIIAASQINRDGVSNHWRPPALHTLAQSDHLGNDGDVVITMKRYGLGAAVSSLEKNRHGASGICFFNKYDANNGDFSEITRDQADDIKMAEEDNE